MIYFIVVFIMVIYVQIWLKTSSLSLHTYVGQKNDIGAAVTKGQGGFYSIYRGGKSMVKIW